MLNIELMDLLLALLVAAGIVFVVFLIILLARLARVIKQVSHLVTDIEQPVNETVEQLPDLLKKVDGIVKDVSELTDTETGTVPGILGDAKAMTGTVRTGVEAVGQAATSVSDGVSSIFGKARRHADHASGIVDIIGQVMTVIGFFTNQSKKSKAKKSRSGFGKR